MRHYFFLCLISVLFLNLSASAQFVSPNVIALGSTVSGITDLKIADLNQDGIKDLIFGRSYNGDELAYFTASTSITFNPKQLVDSNLLNAQAIAVGDLNGDQWPDLVGCGQQNGDLYWYPNHNGSFSNRIRLDSGIFFPHDIEIVDVDSNQTLDIVFIGQHSIDLFTGDGNGNFTKSHILTTSSSPRILELFDVDPIDLNHDSLPDLVTAETLGAVVYDNQGNGNFTTRVLNSNFLTANLVHLVDLDNDRDKDILLRHTNKSFDWFENNGNGQFTQRGTITHLPQFETINTLDLNGDSLMDIYGSTGNQTIICFNDTSQSFINQTTSHQNSSLNFINTTTVSDLNNDQRKDVIWSDVSGYLALQINNQGVGIDELRFEKTDLIYPNPAKDILYLKNNQAIAFVEIYSVDYKTIKTARVINRSAISVTHLRKGNYIIKFYTKTDSLLGSQKLIIQ